VNIVEDNCLNLFSFSYIHKVVFLFLIWDIYVLMPLMHVIYNVNGYGLMEVNKNFQSHVMMN